MLYADHQPFHVTGTKTKPKRPVSCHALPSFFFIRRDTSVAQKSSDLAVTEHAFIFFHEIPEVNRATWFHTPCACQFASYFPSAKVNEQFTALVQALLLYCMACNFNLKSAANIT